MPSLTNFIHSFSADVARPKQFDVTIPAPLPLLPYLGTARNLSFRCESTQLPSRTFATAEQKFGTNPTEKHAYHSQYNDVDMTFIVSDDMSEKLFFDAWMEYINPTITFDFNYKSDYISTLTINQYDVSNELTYSINLIDAFPISVNQLDMDWSNEGHHKLTVVFAYRYWQNNSIQQLGSSLLQDGISRIINTIGGLSPDPILGETPDYDSSIYANRATGVDTGATAPVTQSDYIGR